MTDTTDDRHLWRARAALARRRERFAAVHGALSARLSASPPPERTRLRRLWDRRGALARSTAEAAAILTLAGMPVPVGLAGCSPSCERVETTPHASAPSDAGAHPETGPRPGPDAAPDVGLPPPAPPPPSPVGEPPSGQPAEAASSSAGADAGPPVGRGPEPAVSPAPVARALARAEDAVGAVRPAPVPSPSEGTPPSGLDEP